VNLIISERWKKITRPGLILWIVLPDSTVLCNHFLLSALNFEIFRLAFSFEAVHEKLEDGTRSGKVPKCPGVVTFGETLY
jgi:hypothetical protein